MNRAIHVLCLIAILAVNSTSMGQTLVQNLLWTSPPDYVLDKQFANDHYGVDMFCQPYAGGLGYIISSAGTISEFAAIADPCWNRVLYLSNASPDILSHGSPGSSTNQYHAPCVVKVFTPNDWTYSPVNYWVPNYYSVFVCDNGNHRIQQLRFDRTNPQNGLASIRYFSGSQMPSPVDFDYDNRGVYHVETDDYLWVVNQNNTISRVLVNTGAITLTYGSTGAGNGQFDSLTLIACGHDPYTRSNDNTLFVADAKNSRIVKLSYSGNTVTWVAEAWNYFTPLMVDLESDTYGHLWALTSSGFVIKFSPGLEVLDELNMSDSGIDKLVKPTSMSNAGGFGGSGGMMFTESWSAETGVKGFTIGTDVKDLYANSNPQGGHCVADVYMRLTDVTALRVRIHKPDGTLVKTLKDSFTDGYAVFAGAQRYPWDGKNTQGQYVPGGQYFVEAKAQSNYLNPYTQDFSATVYDTVYFTHCNPPCTWLVGDANGSGGYSISDCVKIISYIFSGGSPPTPHPVGSGDANCSHAVSISDAVYLKAHIFESGPPPQCTCSDYQ